MSHARSLQRIFVVAAIGLAGLLCWPAEGHAQTVSGYARAIQGTVLGTSGVFADTGSLVDSSDAREAQSRDINKTMGLCLESDLGQI